MLKKRIKAALILIATEDINAVRVLLRNMTNLASRATSIYKKS